MSNRDQQFIEYLEICVLLNYSVSFINPPSLSLMQNSFDFAPWIRNIFLYVN